MFETPDELTRGALVIVEDHVYHIDRLLEVLAPAWPQLLAQTTVFCLDRPGPDTEGAVRRWRSAHPQLQICAALADGHGHMLEPGVFAFDSRVFAKAPAYQRWVAACLRPGGILLQDIQLESLSFLPPDDWWESIYLANAVRGSFVAAPPLCMFMSNKRGFHATFAADLVAAEFDPRDVLAKDRLDDLIVPLLRKRLAERMPWELDSTRESRLRWMSDCDAEVASCAEAHDLVIWPEQDGKVRLSGQALASRRPLLELVAEGHEARSWAALIDARLACDDAEGGGHGLTAAELGRRLSGPGSERAEQGSSAAKHVFALRKRLERSDMLHTGDQGYALRNQLNVARVGFRVGCR